MANKKINNKLQIWIEARKRFHLSHAQIQMARELGLNPKGFGKIANCKQEKWKLPLPQFIEEIYFKRFGRAKPGRITSIEEKALAIRRKKEERKNRKRPNQGSEIEPTPEQLPTGSDPGQYGG